MLGNQNRKSHNQIRKIGILLSIYLLIVFCVVGCGGQKAKIKEQLKLGERYLKELQYDEAIVIFENIIQIEPNNVDAYIGLVEAYIKTGNWEKALEVCEDGYNSTSDKYFLKQKEEITKQLEENKKKYAEEIRAQVELDGFWDKALEISTICRNHRLGMKSIYQIGSSAQLTDNQIKSLCEPYIEILESYREYFPENYYEWFMLEDFYYGIGQLEKCLEVRTQLYELSGEEEYKTEETVSKVEGSEFVYNEYGNQKYYMGVHDYTEQKVVSTEEYIYDEQERLICYNKKNEQSSMRLGSYGIETEKIEYIYDEEGRVVQRCIEIYNNDKHTAYEQLLITTEYYVYNKSGYTVESHSESYFRGEKTSSGVYVSNVKINEYGEVLEVETVE